MQYTSKYFCFALNSSQGIIFSQFIKKNNEKAKSYSGVLS